MKHQIKEDASLDLFEQFQNYVITTFNGLLTEVRELAESYASDYERLPSLDQ